MVNRFIISVSAYYEEKSGEYCSKMNLRVLAEYNRQKDGRSL